MGKHHASTALSVFALGILLVFAAGYAASATAAEFGEREVTLPGDGISLKGILFQPASDHPLPAVIVLHGWAPATVPGAPRVADTARMLSQAGYVALAVSMRGWPGTGGRDDCGFDQPNDIAKAAEWLAGLPGVDRERIGVIGFSQGGQVALLTAALTRRVKAVVAYYPVTDIDLWKTTTNHPGIPDYVRYVCTPGGTVFRSPVHVAKKIVSPVLLIHGDQDRRVPTEQSLVMRDALMKANRPADLHLVQGAVHGFTAQQWAESWPIAVEFLDRYLKKTQ